VRERRGKMFNTQHSILNVQGSMGGSGMRERRGEIFNTQHSILNVQGSMGGAACAAEVEA
jgi:hypothetical protein